MTTVRLHDPTSERAPVDRARVSPSLALDQATIALLDLGKIRSDDFLDTIEVAMHERGLKTLRFAKPTNAKPAPIEIIDAIVAEADVVVEALAD